MKIRIRDNSLRLRLMQTEVKQFDENQVVEARIHFGADSENTLTYRLEKSKTATSIQCTYSNNCISVVVPQQLAAAWANSDQVSLSAEQLLNNEQPLAILIEKDFQCLTDRIGEDESDAFPNPNTSC